MPRNIGALYSLPVALRALFFHAHFISNRLKSGIGNHFPAILGEQQIQQHSLKFHHLANGFFMAGSPENGWFFGQTLFCSFQLIKTFRSVTFFGEHLEKFTKINFLNSVSNHWQFFSIGCFHGKFTDTPPASPPQCHRPFEK